MRKSEALRYRNVIEDSAQSLTDDVALTVVNFHPMWGIGIAYAVGFKVQRNGKLWRCIQAHASIDGWEPENAPSLWEQINETHKGSIDDPIPYEGNMALVNGLYYVQDSVVYMCIRDTVNPVYNALVDLVGLYVEVVK